MHTLPPTESPNSAPCAAVQVHFDAKLDSVNAYIGKYRLAHPQATKREACMEGLRKRGLLSALPASLRK